MEAAPSFDQSQMGQVAVQKAKEMFALCDGDDKGFIIKTDMQKLRDELPGLTADQLEEVFDSLDQDKNGYLTMEEFVNGFGAFLGLRAETITAEPANLAQEIETANMKVEDPAADKEQFDDLMHSIGAVDVFAEQPSVQSLWTKLRHDDPELLTHFESFLSDISGELRRKKNETTTLENALHERTQTHDEQVNKLYEEMEQQLKAEKEKVAIEERQKAQREREQLERALAAKDDEMQEIIRKQTTLEKQLGSLKDTAHMSEQEKQEVAAERAAFERQRMQMQLELDVLRREHDDSRTQLDKLKQVTKLEKRAKAQNALRVTENVANEREGFVKTIDHLSAHKSPPRHQIHPKKPRQQNIKLQDERDEVFTAVPPPIQTYSSHSQSVPGAKKDSSQMLMERDDVLQHQGGLANAGGNPYGLDDDLQNGNGMLGDDAMYDEEVERVNAAREAQLPPAGSMLGGGGASLADELAGLTAEPRGNQQSAMQRGGSGAGAYGLGLGTPEYAATDDNDEGFVGDTDPDRIFKVVFVGDSGVGKTCFLHRFCHNTFKPTFSATIGVDFTVKSIRVGDRVVALQLWDTAGQERFRSITKQYFRKADGVVLMYDVTSELSFINVRNWMNNVMEGVESGCVLCLVGNKVDILEGGATPGDSCTRAVTSDDGSKLADSYGCLFFETSACSGHGVPECMRAMAVHLQEREDQHLEEALKLDLAPPKKKGCCK